MTNDYPKPNVEPFIEWLKATHPRDFASLKIGQLRNNRLGKLIKHYNLETSERDSD